jgi:hypothetical protein
MVGIRTFENGTLDELDSFFPRPLSTRALLATMAKVYDSTGMLSPLIGSLRLSFSDCSNNGGCKNWDEGIRRKFIERMYQVNLVRNMTYNRSDTPKDAIP